MGRPYEFGGAGCKSLAKKLPRRMKRLVELKNPLSKADRLKWQIAVGPFKGAG